MSMMVLIVYNLKQINKNASVKYTFIIGEKKRKKIKKRYVLKNVHDIIFNWQITGFIYKWC